MADSSPAIAAGHRLLTVVPEWSSSDHAPDDTEANERVWDTLTRLAGNGGYVAGPLPWAAVEALLAVKGKRPYVLIPIMDDQGRLQRFSELCV